MLRLRGHVSYANIAATLALVLAIGGGGYAIAHGTAARSGGEVNPHLLAGSVKPLEPRSQKLLLIPGVGRLTADCDKSGRTSATFENQSNRTLVARSLINGEDFQDSSNDFTVTNESVLGPGEQSFYGGTFDSSTVRLSLFPKSPSESRPQADVTINLTRGCGGADALALSTEG
jgi:hypothetical protein